MDLKCISIYQIDFYADCLKCPVTGKSPSAAIHQGRHDYKYVTPILKKEALEKSDLVNLVTIFCINVSISRLCKLRYYHKP